MPLTRDEVRNRVVALAQTDNRPTLTEAELDVCLDRARRPDAADLAYGDAGYEDTYSVAAAVAEAWTLKGAKAAADYDFTADGQTFKRGSVRAACLEMARQYRRQERSDFSVGAPS